MIELFKSLFMTTDRAGPMIDSVSKGLDSLVHTGQEKSQMLLAWIAATGPTNVSRRFIAFTVTFIWGLHQIINMILIILCIWWDLSEVQVALTEHINDTLNWAFMLVMGFYFAPHALAALKASTLLPMKKE